MEYQNEDSMFAKNPKIQNLVGLILMHCEVPRKYKSFGYQTEFIQPWYISKSDITECFFYK